MIFNNKLFGTDGIRAKAGHYPLTSGVAYKLGRVAAIWLLNKDYPRACPRWKHTGTKKLFIIIGKDTRTSCDFIEHALTKGISSKGIKVVKAGVITTPGLAYITKKIGASLGIMISASHNPACDNGIKFFTSGGFKLTNEEENQLEEIFFNSDLKITKHTKSAPIVFDKKLSKHYIDFLVHLIGNINMNNIKIVIDCSNGAICAIAPQLFKRLHAEVIFINRSANGKNINFKCGSLHPQVISKRVLKEKADVGFSFDGDGDRVILSDENGHILDGDYIMAIVMNYLCTKDITTKKAVVTTHMSNFGFEAAMKDKGIDVFRTDVGDRYVLDAMLKNKIAFGGEQSGHIIFLNHTTTGDGLVTALKVLQIMQRTKKSLCELSSCMRKFPQILVNVEIKEKRPLDEIPQIKEAILEARRRLKNKGRIFVRYSGTQNLARVMVEGRSKDEVKEIANSIAKLFVS